MKLLLDTCTLIWLASEPRRLSRPVARAIDDAANELWLSDASVLEIGLKYSAGKLDLPQPPRAWVGRQCEAWGLRTAGVSREIILRVTELPAHHPDPVDRLLVATALVEGLTLVTPDAEMERYPVSVLW